MTAIPPRATVPVLFAAALLCGFGPAPAATAGRASGADRDRAARLMAEALERRKPDRSRREAVARESRLLPGSVRERNGSWTGAALVRTAFAGRMTTERLALTVPSGSAATAPDDVRIVREDVHDRAFRFAEEDQSFRRFDAFRLAREGLEITSGPGTLVAQSRGGRVERILLQASENGGLAFRYAPPRPRDRFVLRRHDEAAAHPPLDPGFVEIACDAATCSEFLRSVRGGRKISRRRLGGALKRVLEEEWVRNARERAARPFSGFAARPDTNGPAGSDGEPLRRWRVEIAAAEYERRVALDFDGARPFEVAWSEKIPPGGTNGAAPGASWRTRIVSPAEASLTGGAGAERSGPPPEARGRGVAVVRLAGVVRVEDGQRAAGTGDGGGREAPSRAIAAEIAWTVRFERSAGGLTFRTGAGDAGVAEAGRPPALEVDALTGGDGRDLTFVRLDDSGGFIELPEPAEAGSTREFRASVRVRGALAAVGDTALVASRAGWLPLPEPGDPVPDVDLTFDTPEAVRALGAGRLVSETVADGRRRTRWISRTPLGAPILVAGRFAGPPVESVLERPDGTQTVVAAHAPDGTVPVSRGRLTLAATEAARALETLAGITGVRHQPERFDLVVMPEGEVVPVGPFSRGEACRGVCGEGSPRAAAVRGYWSLVLAGANGANAWIRESLVEFSNAFVAERAGGRAEYRARVDRWWRDFRDSGLDVSLEEAPYLWTAGSGDSRRGFEGWRARGAGAWHMLRASYGDGKFFDFLGVLSRELRGRMSTGRDVQKVAEGAFGGEMAWFFDQWVRGVGVPEYTFEHRVRPAGGGGFLVEGTVRQRVVLEPAGAPGAALGAGGELEGTYFQGFVPITIELEGGGEVRRQLIIESRPRTDFRFRLEQRPRTVVFDKYREVLARRAMTS